MMYVALTFDQQPTSNYVPQKHPKSIRGVQGALSGITYNLIQDQLSLYVTFKELY